MLKKFLILFLLIGIAIVIAGIYGIIHDQLTCTISPEYYTKFKFQQFRISPDLPFRLGVAVVGWNATWWMGIPIGIILGAVGLTHKAPKQMLWITIKAFLITMAVAFLTGLVGLLYGEMVLANKPVSYFDEWFIPENLNDFRNFISVGSMHNFSYIGGLLGALAGVVYSLRRK
jgi:hypothetical protein